MPSPYARSPRRPAQTRPLSPIISAASAKLFDAVLLRRATELNAIRQQELEQLEANAGPDGPSVEEIINAFTHPLLDRTANGGPGWKSYFALIGQITNTTRMGRSGDEQVFRSHRDPLSWNP